MDAREKNDKKFHYLVIIANIVQENAEECAKKYQLTTVVIKTQKQHTKGKYSHIFCIYAHVKNIRQNLVEFAKNQRKKSSIIILTPQCPTTLCELVSAAKVRKIIEICKRQGYGVLSDRNITA